MPGAILAAVGWLEAAIGEIAARRIAERPSAGGAPDLLKAHPSHLPDPGVGERECQPPDRLVVRQGGGGFPDRGPAARGAPDPLAGGPVSLFPSNLIEFADD